MRWLVFYCSSPFPMLDNCPAVPGCVQTAPAVPNCMCALLLWFMVACTLCSWSPWSCVHAPPVALLLLRSLVAQCTLLLWSLVARSRTVCVVFGRVCAIAPAVPGRVRSLLLWSLIARARCSCAPWMRAHPAPTVRGCARALLVWFMDARVQGLSIYYVGQGVGSWRGAPRC